MMYWMKRLKLYDSGLDRLQISLYDGEDQHQHLLSLENSVWIMKNMFTSKISTQEKDFGITISNRGGMLASKYKIDPQIKIKRNVLFKL